jgi:hypothetical protein
MVFHRILDFKTRLDFYPASIFLYTPVPAAEGNLYQLDIKTAPEGVFIKLVTAN